MTDEFSKNLAILEKLLKKEENRFCADCRRKSPCWASTTFGTFICIKCSGFHRELGTHITKVRSVNLDKWSQENIALYQKMNNEIANAYWENRLKDFSFEKLQSDDYKLNQFIIDKYVKKQWARKKKEDPATLILQGKSNEDEEEEPEPVVEKKVKPQKEVEQKKKEEKVPSIKKIDSPQKVQTIPEVNKNPNQSRQKQSQAIEFNDFEEAKVESSKGQDSLIDLHSNQNLQELKFKEKTDNIFKLFSNEAPNNQTSNIQQQTVNTGFQNQIGFNNGFNNGQMLGNNQMYRGQMISNQFYNQYPMQQFNPGYNMYNVNPYQQNQFQNNPYNGNSLVNLNGGFNMGMSGNNFYSGMNNNTGNQTYNLNNGPSGNVNNNYSGNNFANNNNTFNSPLGNKIEVNSNNKNADPFKGLVNFNK